ncbi:MAG: hypothetical protein ABSG14_00360 [Verrucomicrobiia bacterium]|jgi:hypothetical protein
MPENDYDLYAFVAGDALKEGHTFQLQCNCGGTAPMTPPLKTEFVVCPKCASKIKVLVIAGDPGYIIGRDASGEPTLLSVQGSAATPPHQLPPEERRRIIERVKQQMRKQGK